MGEGTAWSCTRGCEAALAHLPPHFGRVIRRFIVLRDDSIEWYKDAKFVGPGSRPKGALPLSASTTVEDEESIQKGLDHKPFNINSEQHQAFLDKLSLKMKKLKQRLPFIEF